MATVDKNQRHAGGRPRIYELSDFGRRLDAMCASRNLTRNDLAKITGLNHVTIWRWMVGLSEPTLSGASKLAQAAGGQVTDLLPKKSSRKAV
jgi:transcriptional regulator with XRE-family HTH domain